MPRPRFSLGLAYAALLLPAFGAGAGVPAPSAYLDPTLPVEARVRDLVSRLTLDEKAHLMRNGATGVPRLGIPEYDWWNEALHGVARAGTATVFPQAIGLAAMWDEPFLHTIADTIATEARAKHEEALRRGEHRRYQGLTFWSPNINIFRDPRWGRGQETYGEDPYLTSRLGVAFVRGLQGDDPRYLKAAACAKHFAVHSGPEPLRHHFDVEPDEADFHDTYLRAFEALVRDAHVEAVMTAYNSVDGKPCAINDRLYDLLYRQWGFNGHVVSDCGAISDLYETYRVAPDAAAAEALAIKAGLCLRCGEEETAIADAVRRGLLTERDVDLRVGQLLRTMFRLGFFDPPASVPYTRIPFSENNSPAHAALALEAARKSIVLLKNDGVLPLRRAALHRVAVIGPGADSVPVLLGNYNGTPTAPVTVLAGLRAALGPDVVVDYQKGCSHVASKPGRALIDGHLAIHNPDRPGFDYEVFANPALTGAPVFHRTGIGAVEFDWAKEPAPPTLPKGPLSMRWRGDLLTEFAGEYEITLTGNGGFRLWLDGRLAIDAWEPGAKTRSCRRVFPANGSTPLRLEYFQGDAPAALALQWTPPPTPDLTPEIVARARLADAVIFVGGISPQLEGEEMRVEYDGFNGGDRTRIELPAVQEKLLQALQATGRPIIFVLMSGSAIADPWADAHVNAILEAWYPGQAGGTAVADVLLGRTNPAGRLPVTFYRSTSDLPEFTDYHMANRTYRYFRGQPLYPFGHGLSYTRFSYANLRVASDPSRVAGRFTITLDVTNRGERDGDEVVQLYAEEPAADHPRALESLCGFRRIHLAQGQTQTVTFTTRESDLQRWDSAQKTFALPRGEWQFRAGASSADIRVTAPARID